ncbi:hypothetical protein Tco_0604767 [Tanacetum coccineum]
MASRFVVAQRSTKAIATSLSSSSSLLKLTGVSELSCWLFGLTGCLVQFPSSSQASVKFHFRVRERSDFSEEARLEKSRGRISANERDSEAFVNVFVRIGFGSTIKLVSFNKSQVVTVNRKFIRGFRNSDCRPSWSGINVSSPHGFIIHWIEIFENHEKVTKVVDVENWRIENSQVLRWVVSLIERNSPVS